MIYKNEDPLKCFRSLKNCRPTYKFIEQLLLFLDCLQIGKKLCPVIVMFNNSEMKTENIIVWYQLFT